MGGCSAGWLGGDAALAWHAPGGALRRPYQSTVGTSGISFPFVQHYSNAYSGGSFRGHQALHGFTTPRLH